jgi:hypothetical protein
MGTVGRQAEIYDSMSVGIFDELVGIFDELVGNMRLMSIKD